MTSPLMIFGNICGTRRLTGFRLRTILCLGMHLIRWTGKNWTGLSPSAQRCSTFGSQNRHQVLVEQEFNFCKWKAMKAPMIHARIVMLRVEGERASHLNQCTDVGRTKLFDEMVDPLENCMLSTPMDPNLACWIPKYLHSRNGSSFYNLYPPPCLARLVDSQDSIG